jgi:F-type H+-transporting ATPase subunit delta
MKETGGKVEMTEKVDQNILGGFILNWDDLQIDASVTKKLSDLRMEFSKNTTIK